MNGLGLETWLVWIDWVWGSKLFLSLDLSSLYLSGSKLSLSLNLGANRPLLPVIVRFTISSFLELVDLFSSQENEVKVWIFDYLFFLASKLVWFLFGSGLNEGKLRGFFVWSLCSVWFPNGLLWSCLVGQKMWNLIGKREIGMLIN